MTIDADAQLTASTVRLETVVCVVLVTVETHPITSVAIATVTAIRSTEASNGEIPFIQI
jgi:hypothetical protein